jgi:glyoxylase I family protein
VLSEAVTGFQSCRHPCLPGTTEWSNELDKTLSGRKSAPLQQLPLRMHHHAFTTDDHEANRQFYEDVLGIPLTAMYVEKELIHGEWIELGHAFYSLQDGSALAFFNFADENKQRVWKAREQSIFVHLSLLVEAGTQTELKERITAAGLESFTLEHGFCTSLYVKDPNGLLVEFTVDHPDASAIAAEMAERAQQDLKRWVAGDRTPNNRWRPDVGSSDASV